MEWIETTGRTVEEAQEAALDELGVDATDAEFEVLAEPKSGLFGRMRVEARVRARVRPTAPRPKEDRRERRRRAPKAGDGTTATEAVVDTTGDDVPVVATAVLPAQDAAAPAATAAPAPTANGSGRRSEGRTRRPTDQGSEERTMDIPLDEQAAAAVAFVQGLLETFGVHGDVVTAVDTDEEVVDVKVTGDGLGLLIGPKGTTLMALQDLLRAAVQQATGSGTGRLNLDVSGYRAKRSEALVRFATQVAETVVATGQRQALEPMSAIDRKVIHDALTDVPGVSTVSQGEDAERRVVIVPVNQ